MGPEIVLSSDERKMILITIISTVVTEIGIIVFDDVYEKEWILYSNNRIAYTWPLLFIIGFALNDILAINFM